MDTVPGARAADLERELEVFMVEHVLPAEAGYRRYR
jgi:hypothetical protein